MLEKSVISKEMSADFLKALERVGVQPSEVENGQTVSRTITIESLAKFKEIFAQGIKEEARTTHSNRLKDVYPEAFESTTKEYLLTRISSYIYGSDTLSSSDEELAASMFPMPVMVEAAQDTTIDSPVVYGPSGTPTTLIYETLTFTNDGSITTLNTSLTLMTTTLEVAVTGLEKGLINVLGVTGDSGLGGTNGTSYTEQAANGKDSKPASPGICTGEPKGGTGTDGKNGGDGGKGKDGDDGLPSLQTFISISGTLKGVIPIFTQSGAGGAGGIGGAGGKGQDGGNGGKGCGSGCECTSGGNGGAGGNGGNGGSGGDGGNGVDGNDIVVSLPSSTPENSVIKMAYTAYPGSGGGIQGVGKKGLGGSGGGTGSKGNCKKGSSGSDGIDGKSAGTPGSHGTTTGSPGAIIVQYN